MQNDVKRGTRISASQLVAAYVRWMSVVGLLNGISGTVPLTGLELQRPEIIGKT